ncbi:BlaI/MecI/CopY family transcriptional regulator [Actinoallomurus sp. NBC_01490]|uniref:BlaI/MecI/CopY family transcriptional regulator n=1 Tax=Actinoallomurus sp. NBC_01490 TaxID=2903557 RepID=UPI002E362C73|nr:BlaI/MecI/CopY family transcriptional regulator [Actinoallomurus sp. NBC_01490]
MAGRPNPRPSGSLESEVVACLAAADRPLTPAEVQAELGGDLAYTTVMTTLTRLYSKRALSRKPHGRSYAYELVGGPDGASASITAHQMQKLLQAGVDRASVLSRFVDGLDEEAEQILLSLLTRGSADDQSPADSAQARSRRKS